jgi:catechol 2,3-dioxygenase-like lactoylglutathione lyase family enzyme
VGEFIQGLDHVTVTTPEELESEVVAWYRECLRLPTVDRPDGATGSWFKAGSQEVHVSVDPHNPPKTAHFGLTVDDLPVAIDRLRSFGCHIEQAKSIPGRQRFFTRDPAGNRVEILAYDELPAQVAYEEGPE